MKKEMVISRIEKAKDFISKKYSTIERKKELINKKSDKLLVLNDQEKRWMECGIENLRDDIKSLERQISEKKISLKKYENELKIIIEKENSRNIKVILDFLERWKQQVKGFYESNVNAWIETLNKYREEDRKHCEWYNTHFAERNNKELIKQMEEPVKVAKMEHKQYNFLDSYMDRHGNEYALNTEKLQKDLDYEANRKYDFIIERTNKIVGEIIDATNLDIGEKGDLNGYIIGTKGKASVQTVGAGGYNIQCYHFRTIISEIK